jgi:hypothetical protein
MVHRVHRLARAKGQRLTPPASEANRRRRSAGEDRPALPLLFHAGRLARRRRPIDGVRRESGGASSYAAWSLAER